MGQHIRKIGNANLNQENGPAHLSKLDVFLLWCDDKMGYPNDLSKIQRTIVSDIHSFETMPSHAGQPVPDIGLRLARARFINLQLSPELRRTCLESLSSYRPGADVRIRRPLTMRLQSSPRLPTTDVTHAILPIAVTRGLPCPSNKLQSLTPYVPNLTLCYHRLPPLY